MKKNGLVLKIAIAFLAFTFIISYKQVNSYSSNTIEDIKQYVNLQMKNSKIPGLSVAIVQGEEALLQEGFGVQDLKLKTPVTDKTVFELASNSKAFTALAILNLDYEGKIDLNDDIRNYIPWLKFYYDNEEVRVNVENFLYHTSGIPTSTIYDIPVSNDNKAIENTIKAMNKKLEYLPYEKCVYATINYDVLGLLIEEVTSMSYEEYIKQNILVTLKLNNTYLYKKKVLTNLTPGYKLKFLNPAIYNAPIFRGNKPAGYIMSCASDMAKWLKWQLNYKDDNSKFNHLFSMSHEIKPNNPPLADNLFYTGGWIIDKNKNIILHSGGNPNFSSFIVIDQKNKLGISVLANMKSSYTSHITFGILDILNGNQPTAPSSDINQTIDRIASILIIIFTMLLAFLINSNLKLAKKVSKISNIKLTACNKTLLILGCVTAIVTAYFLFKIPLMFGMKNWDFLRVWYPQTAIYAAMLLAINLVAISMLLLFLGITKIKSKQNKLIL